MAFAQPHRAAPVWYRYGIRVIHRICSCFSPSMAITPTLPRIETNSFIARYQTAPGPQLGRTICRTPAPG